jgi:choline dehydrogenase
MAVVDNKLKVHGLDNLYVADASIMPTVTHANTNVTAIMIGERLSDFVSEAGG